MVYSQRRFDWRSDRPAVSDRILAGAGSEKLAAVGKGSGMNGRQLKKALQPVLVKPNGKRRRWHYRFQSWPSRVILNFVRSGGKLPKWIVSIDAVSRVTSAVSVSGHVSDVKQYLRWSAARLDVKQQAE